MTVRVLGVRHHSPACARLVAHLIGSEKPFAVLIEGPGDFNHRIGELLLDHSLPIALYSYANSGESPAQCWFPFLDYSPEWVALRTGHASGALVRFIDLPHWQYRALPDARKRVASVNPQRERSQYSRVVQKLCAQFACDGDTALWDHLFESLPVNAHEELSQRLDVYFDELRGDDAGTEQDHARELCMARWVAWANAQAADRTVLVVCGGWHKKAIETLWPTLQVDIEPLTPTPADEHEAGSYLVPYEYRQVEALGGYWSGMQSPLFYQWAWAEGLPKAGERAIERIVARLRHRKVAVSTADLIAFQHALAGLSRLRGHEVALRTDILDALQSAIVKEALEAPPPWTTQGLLTDQDHPVLREALIALTGDSAGKLHADTPMPPLLHDVTRRLEQCGVTPTRSHQVVVLDRRREADAPRAHLFWQLSVLGVGGIKLTGMQAPGAARNLRPELRFEEHWTLAQDDRWLPDLIEAAVHGATLEAAARNMLLERVHEAQGNVGKIAQTMLHAIRAGLMDMGLALAQQLQQGIVDMHDHAELAKAAHLLTEVVQGGFWGTDTHELLEGTLVQMAERILWLLEGHTTALPAQISGDVNAVSVFDSLLRFDKVNFDKRATLETLARFATSASRPPAVRGAALGIAHLHGGLGDDSKSVLLSVVRSIPPRDALGDFLYGLFSCARALATQSHEIVEALHVALESLTTDDFLVALPQLRGAFSWFSPRERGSIAAIVARLLGLSGAEQNQLLSLRQGADALLDAKRIEAQALQWARDIGVMQ